jgi:hypothetical protein
VFVVPQTLEVTTTQPEAHTAAGQELASSSSSSSQQKLFRFLPQENSGVFSPTNIFVEKTNKKLTQTPTNASEVQTGTCLR